MIMQSENRTVVDGAAGEKDLRLDIASFLHFGYVPRPNTYSEARPVPVFDWSALTPPTATPEEVSDDELVARGAAALREGFTNTEGRLHVVPLSGGMDSRAVLGALREHVEASRIVTVTFGVPGARDFEIGPAIARHLGLRHVAVDLDRIDPTAEDLLASARTVDGWTFLFDAFYNRIITGRFGKEVVYWSGLMGDPIAGSHLQPVPSSSWEEARRGFAERNRFVKDLRLSPADFSAEEVLPPQPLLPSGVLELDEQLDFVVRQGSYIHPTLIVPGFDVRTPLLAPSWVSFMLGLPRRQRMHKRLYRKILSRMFPELFSLPVDRRVGAARILYGGLVRSRQALARRLSPPIGAALDRRFWTRLRVYASVNYIDFDSAVRSRPAFHALLRDLVGTLEERRVVDWLDLPALWRGAEHARPGAGKALALLGALEIVLRTRGHR